jgi:hypothetical protein
MRRIVRFGLALALLAAVAALPSAAAAAVRPAIVPPPPADGSKVPVDLWGRTDTNGCAVYQYPAGSGPWYLDAVFANSTDGHYSSGVILVDPMVTVEYRTAAGVHVSYETFAAPAKVMPFTGTPGSYRQFHHRLTVPASAAATATQFFNDSNPLVPDLDYGTAASTAKYQEIDWSLGPIDKTTLGDGRNQFILTASNNATMVVGPVLVTGNEVYGAATPGQTYFLDAFDVTPTDPAKAARLMPGQETSFTVRCLASTPTTATSRQIFNRNVEAEPLPIAQVWRFYNVRTGTHFYTSDPAERDNVLATLGAIYHLDGLSYVVHEEYPDNTTMLWRFYNRITGTHFYTADPAEKANLLATMGGVYQLDGPTYYVSSVFHAGYDTVWRFFNLRTGTHFYTADPSEMAHVRDTMASTYHLDGPAFYLAK